MKATLLRWCFVAVVLGWGVLAWTAYRRNGASAEPAPPRARPPVVEKHYVTPKQLVDSGAMRDRRVSPFAAVAGDGRRIDWQELIGDRPVVMVFIKRDCPCSVEFEPYFHQLHRLYREQVQFIGLIDAPPSEARRYADANHVPYPILADADQAIIRGFHAENGGYVVLLRHDGSVETLWPGCSATMMRELGARIAALAEVDERQIDVTGMPTVLTTGCPFAS
jgi:peroxiredoxin